MVIWIKYTDDKERRNSSDIPLFIELKAFFGGAWVSNTNINEGNIEHIARF